MSDKENDPFAAFESDRTVIKPGAGRRGAAAPAGPAAGGGGGGAGAGGPPGGGGFGFGGGGGGGGGGAGGGGAGKEAPLALDALMTTNINPLVAAAAPLLSAAPRIRTMVQHPNPAGLKEALADGVRKFEAAARGQGLPNEQVIAGRYIICTLLDEMAASTPWGGSGQWAAQSLLVQFHNESWGGEKVFALMARLAENVPANRNLLELMYVVLAFGFEGRYRVQNDGRAQLESVRTRLAQMLKAGKGGDGEKALSPRWEGVPAGDGKLHQGIPMWVVMTLAAVVLAVIYVALRLSINAHSDPVFTTLATLDVKAAPPSAAPPPPPPPAEKPRLAAVLKADIDQGLVQVQDLADRSVVVIKGDGLFDPGSAVINNSVMPLISRIQGALMQMPGQILITGHTDNQPIRSLRFPSNWHLSQDRANTIRQMLAANIKPERLRAEGRGDAEPVADNGTPAGRSQNRRVEITLFVAGGA